MTEQLPQPALFSREKVLRFIGLTEVLPSERDQIENIRWNAYEIRSALRLGEVGAYLYDPENKMAGEFPDAGELKKLEYTMKVALAGIPVSDFDVEGLENPDLIKGISRRLKGRRLPPSISPENLQIAARLIWHQIHNPEKPDTGKPNFAIIAHRNTPHVGKIIEREIGKRISKDSRLEKISTYIQDFANFMVFASVTPYLGASIIMAEMEQKDIAGKMEIIDYSELQEGIQGKFGNLNPKYALLTGALSLDMKDLGRYETFLNDRGVTCILGGLAPTIDINAAVLLTKKTHLFVGEAEGAMEQLFAFLDKAPKDRRYIFHRGGNSEEPKVVPDTNHVGVDHVYLNASPMVDLTNYYSPTREKSGQIARRARHQMEMTPTLKAFGKEWDSPDWLMSQVEVTRGCPKSCVFCSTPRSVGQEMRRMPIESVEMQLAAIESKVIVAVDQNFGGISPRENNPAGIARWEKYMMDFFRLIEKRDMRFLCQTELDYFARVIKNPELARLVKKGMLGALTGIEDPRGVKGNALKSHTESFRSLMGNMSQLGIMNLATAVAGLPEELQVEGRQLSAKQIANWAIETAPNTLVAFPLMAIPGAAGVPQTLSNASVEGLYAKSFTTEKAYQESREITQEYYRFQNILRRMLASRNLSPKRAIFTLGLNLAVKSMLLAGSDFRMMGREMR